jgi:hypothetical protein
MKDVNYRSTLLKETSVQLAKLLRIRTNGTVVGYETVDRSP